MSRLPQLQALVKSLPPSPLRERGTPQLSDAIESILTRHFPPGSSTTSSSSAGPSIPPRPRPAGSIGSMSRSKAHQEELRKLSETRKQEAVDGMIMSIKRLQANAVAQEYPLSDKLLKPPHDPNTYLRIYNGLHRSLEGKARAWWKRFFQVRGAV